MPLDLAGAAFALAGLGFVVDLVVDFFAMMLSADAGRLGERERLRLNLHLLYAASTGVSRYTWSANCAAR